MSSPDSTERATRQLSGKRVQLPEGGGVTITVVMAGWGITDILLSPGSTERANSQLNSWF
jgi:hypothetical protein